ncbi:lactococcin 972 family bacteriocin [Actinobaculum sp. 313]|nr:lactococcin 972 family bacteriocin [Actinobaculum sp. 313]
MKVGKRIKSVVLAVGLVLGTGSAALAERQYASGGEWVYGKRGVGVAFSDYYHGSRCHGSSITREGKIQARSAATTAGKWSRASKQGAPWTTYRYHYRFDHCG